MTDIGYFPQNYGDARLRFGERARLIPDPKEFGSWKVPSKTDADLWVDHLWLPPTETPEKLFVITSGIHGSETYAGSAIQAMWLNEILQRLDRRHAGVLLVHSMNPYGFKNHERCTENGVNLNRNFSVSGKLFQRPPDPENTRLNEKFLLREPVRSLQSRVLESLERKEGSYSFDGVSMNDFFKILAPGQTIRPDFLEYGGRALEPQSRLFIEKIRTVIAPFRDIIALDLHTGLGHRGRLHLLIGGNSEPINSDLFSELYHPEKDAEFYEFTPPKADGFYDVFGSICSVYGELATPRQRACAITMEFGTHGHSLDNQLDGLNTSILALQGTHFGYATPELKNRIRTDLFERSYPQDDRWRVDVIRAARGLFERVFTRARVLA